MTNISIIDMTGAEKGTINADAVLVQDKGDQAVKDAVVAYLTNCRQGNACTKTRGEVAGSNAKPWRQKGTGRARSGEKRSPVWRGGGVVFGPRPRHFEWNLNQKVRTLALQRAFSDRIIEEEVIAVEAITPATAKTKDFAAQIMAIAGTDNVLVLVDNVDTNLRLASRNLPKVDVIRACDISAYMMLLHKKVIISKVAYDVLVGRFNKEDAK